MILDPQHLDRHDYPGNRPDVTQFPTVIDHLLRNYTAATTGSTPDDRADEAEARRPGTAAGIGAGGGSAGSDPAAITVIFDAGQNSAANLKHLTDAGLHFIGSAPPSDGPDRLALPVSRRRTVDDQRYPGVTAIDTHRIPPTTGSPGPSTHRSGKRCNNGSSANGS